MRLKPAVPFVSFVALSGALVVAQQPGPLVVALQPGPLVLAQQPGPVVLAQQPDGPPMGPGQGKMDQSRGGWGEGMRSGFRVGPPGIWWHNPDLIQKLTLTPDQQKRMDDILQQSRLQLIDLRANVEKQEILMEPMLAANPPDTNKVLAQIDRTAQARAELEKANAKMLLGIRNVLTPDQWTKLQTEERDNRRMRIIRHGEMPGGPGGSGPPEGGPGGGEGL